MLGVHHDEWLTIIWNKHRLHYVFKDLRLLMTVPVWFWRKQERKGPQHKGSLFLGRDKSEVSFWIFNILQGTKQSYSGPVSEFFFFFFWGEGCGGVLRGSVNCCMLFSQLLCGFVWVASTKKPGKSINLRRNTSYARCGTWKKKETSKGLLVLRAPRVQTV